MKVDIMSEAKPAMIIFFSPKRYIREAKNILTRAVVIYRMPVVTEYEALDIFSASVIGVMYILLAEEQKPRTQNTIRQLIKTITHLYSKLFFTDFI